MSHHQQKMAKVSACLNLLKCEHLLLFSEHIDHQLKKVT